MSKAQTMALRKVLLHPSRLRSYFPFLFFTLGAVVVMAWAASILWSFAYSGLEGRTRGGEITFLDRAAPAAQADVQVGDRLLSIDGLPLTSAFPVYGGKRIGDQIIATLSRSSQIVTTTITLAPPSLPVRIGRLEALLVGVVFWAVSLIVWLLRPFYSTTQLFFLMSHAVVYTLTFGALSTIRWPWSSQLFTFFLLLVATLALHFFAGFPDPLPDRVRRPLLWIIYAIFAVLAITMLVQLMVGPSPLDSPVLWIVRRSYVALALIGMLVLLIRQSRGSLAPLRRCRRLLIAGTAASFLPLLILSFVPELVWGTALIDYTWTFPFLVLLPLAYGYAISQGELGRIDLILNRSLVYALLTALLLGLYALIFFGLERVVPITRSEWVAISIGFVFGAMVLYTPIRARLQQWVDRWFYGGWYDYRMIVLSATAALGQARNLEQLVERLMMVAQTMRFQAAALLWPDRTMLVPKGSFGYEPDVLRLLHVPAIGALAQYLRSMARFVEGEQIGNALDNLTEAERICLPHARIWLPLVSWGTLHGVLVLGERQSEVLLDKEDRDILATLIGQASMAAANVELLESLRMRLAEMKRMRDDLAEAQKRLAEGREEERLHLAQELHDGPVQDLYGILFELGSLSEPLHTGEDHARTAGLQEMTQQVIHTLRTICGELRPPALAPFGLEVAIRSHTQRYQETHPELDVQVDLLPDGLMLSERMRLALFRIYQESMNNITQHADASCVLVRFVLDADQIVLEVRDDGRGFVVPERWIDLARQGHLGLLGIVERAESLGGHIEVIAAPGEGTTIRAIVPRPTLAPTTPFALRPAEEPPVPTT